jgi:putative redox protein
MNGDVIVTEAAGGRYLNHVAAGRHRWLADEPEAIGGTGAGPAPFQMLSAALGACTSMTLRMYAERKELALRRVEVSVSHERHGATDRFVRVVALDGDLDEEQRASLLAIANRCPVHRALEGATQIVTTLQA